MIAFLRFEILRTLRRRSLAALRREAEPVAPDTLARFLPSWHGVGGGRTDLDGLWRGPGHRRGGGQLST